MKYVEFMKIFHELDDTIKLESLLESFRPPEPKTV